MISRFLTKFAQILWDALLLIFLIAFVFISVISQAGAAEARIYGGGYSKHLITKKGSGGITNESHDMIALQYDRVLAGRFNNSYGRESYFIAYEWNWRPFDGFPNVQTFTWAGAVRGYPTCTFDGGKGDSQICLMAVGGARYTKYIVEPTFMMVGEAATIAASIRF